MIYNDDLKKEEILIKGFDAFCGQQISNRDNIGGEFVLFWYNLRMHEIGIFSYKSIPFSIIAVYDKSHLDLYGSLATAHVMFTLGAFN